MPHDGGYSNPTLELLLARASCRSFAGRPIPEDVLRSVLEAGVHAPTAGNLQPYSIIKIENVENRQRLTQLCGRQPFIAGAPVGLLFCIDWHRTQRWTQFEIAPYTAASSFRCFWLAFQDTVIAAQNICTAADSVGLGSVYVGMVMECFSELHEMMNLPNGVLPVVLLCLGYPAKKADPARKLGIDVVVHDETYREIDDEELADAFDEKYRGREREITQNRLDKIYQVCLEVHGEEFAEECLDRIRANGYIGAAQTYFGLLYSANTIPRGNEQFLKTIEALGLDCFKEYHPPGKPAP